MTPSMRKKLWEIMWEPMQMDDKKTNEAILAIQKLYLEGLPEELFQPQFPWKHANEHMNHWKASGWNGCLKDIRRRFES